ncbi:MAG: phosphoesterase [Pirellulales bacterium]|nr:phosphoesterase [Pirellulales bacterium]
MPNIQTEQVLVIPTALFHDLGYFQGFCSEIDRYVGPLFESDAVSYRPRFQMEEDPNYKQLIPYVIFRHASNDGTVRLFQYTRGGGQGEARLHALRSVGVGGHISITDAASNNGHAVYTEGMRRELNEEVSIDTSFTDTCVGLINDDQTPVGRVHLGVVHIYDVEHPAVCPAEEDLLDAGFQPVTRILSELNQFETWSQIAMRALFE